MLVSIPDKILAPWLKNKKYIKPSDEGEGISIAGGYYLATGKRATVAMSADGFCNALCPLTSWVIPEGIEIDLVISTGRQEAQHKVMSDLIESLNLDLPYDTTKISVKFIEKQ
jgi:sulfopyruvate decarboxylase TPP-binding subunit